MHVLKRNKTTDSMLRILPVQVKKDDPQPQGERATAFWPQPEKWRTLPTYGQSEVIAHCILYAVSKSVPEYRRF